MIKTVIFDLDDTLYDYTSLDPKGINRVAAYAMDTFGLSRERFDALYSEAHRRQGARLAGNAAMHNRLVRYQLLLEVAGLPPAHAPEMNALFWNTLLDLMRPTPGAVETLAQLRFMGLTVGIGSNMTADWQFAKLKRLGLMAYVDYIVTSEEAGVEKPSAGLFKLCAEKAGCAPAECAFVGDSLKNDALGARNAGMAAFWFNPGPEAAEVPDGVTRFRAFSELPALLQPTNP